MPAVAVVNIRQLVTMAGPARPRTGLELRELGIIENAVLLVCDGRVVEAGARERVSIPADARIVVDPFARVLKRSKAVEDFQTGLRPR